MKKVLVISLLLFNHASAQTIANIDSSQTLENIIIKAYENNSKLIDVPAAVNIVNTTDLNRYNNTSILSAMNASPGVRMEERSPGSYRLSIRGSSLRSPFGVRNVKVYYDGIPFTDPGGNTYLNQFGFNNIQSVEIIKGPGGSLYGAGTGGVLLIRNDAGKFQPGASVSYDFGSYNLNNLNTNVRFGKENSHNTINYQHQVSDGYRNHTALRRDVFTWDAVMKSNDKVELQAHFLYGDLYYQTPGALTLKEYSLNPKAARPAVGSFPSADQAKAAVYQKTFLAGFSLEQKMNDNWKNTTTIYGAYSQMRNPSFRNYGRTTEPHFGGRTVFQFNKQFNSTLLTFTGGAEMQQSFNTQRIYNNKNGQTDSLQTDDEIYNSQAFVFLQANAELSNGWSFTAAASINRLSLNFTRLSILPPLNDQRHFNNEITPRFALLKKLNNYISAYAIVSRGFSAPTTAELLPSINVFNKILQAESGVDYELGARGSILKNKLYFDINAFFYKLKNAIVQRRDSSGADYFENAGSANQNGLETLLTYEAINNELQFFNHVFIHASDTWNNFHYSVFKQLNNDYSGHQLPGVASQTIAAGIDINTKPGIYANATFFYSGPIAMNDANTEYASAYDLLGLKIGYKYHSSKKLQWEIFTGAENIFNEKYSLGNDINAVGGRYYNAAPGRNYYAGISVGFDKK
ncbi:MAG: TonB-dependent receptor plug domain-containing protein [Bacteroidota bacterium]|nr:TonB-dependent receptor plug domain-containing protein [Bacteroidota bacterium]